MQKVRSLAELTREMISTDAIVVADYLSEEVLLGGRLGPSISTLANWNPGLTVVQFARRNDVKAVLEAGLSIYPRVELPPKQMAFTLSHLGVRPVIYLHAAGLKVGELLWRERVTGSAYGRFSELVQPFISGK